MALRLSTGMRNALLGTQGLKELLDGGFLDIYTGSQPDSANYAETGTKLLRISSTSGADGVHFGTASGGAIPQPASPAWTGTVGVAGVAGWFRFYGTAGTSGSSAAEIRMDGAVGVTGADLNLSHTNLVVGATVTISAVSITEPAE